MGYPCFIVLSRYLPVLLSEHVSLEAETKNASYLGLDKVFVEPSMFWINTDTGITRMEVDNNDDFLVTDLDEKTLDRLERPLIAAWDITITTDTRNANREDCQAPDHHPPTRSIRSRYECHRKYDEDTRPEQHCTHAGKVKRRYDKEPGPKKHCTHARRT